MRKRPLNEGHFARNSFETWLVLHIVAFNGLPARIKKAELPMLAREAFDNARMLLRSGQDLDIARRCFHRGIALLEEFGIDTSELPLIAVDPDRYRDAVRIVGLCTNGRGEVTHVSS